MNSLSLGGRQVVWAQAVNIFSAASTSDTFMLCDLILAWVISRTVMEQQRAETLQELQFAKTALHPPPQL